MSVDGVTYPLAPPFMVLATQNPVETETTFALPAAQLDRFLFKLSMGYPTPRRRPPCSEPWETEPPLRTSAPCSPRRKSIGSPGRSGRSACPIRWWRTSWSWSRPPGSSRSWPAAPAPVSWDPFRASKAYAALSGRDYVTPDDVKYLARYVLPHRVLLSHQAALSGLEAAGVVETVLAQVPCRETGEVLAHGQNA